MKPLILIALILTIVSCTKQVESEEIYIEGFVRDVPDGKVYLTHSHDPKEVLDSTEVVNNYFRFVIRLDSAFVPFRASIHYHDSTFSEYNYIRRIAFLNPHQSTEKMKSVVESFYQSEESTAISVIDDFPLAHHIVGGRDNSLSQKFMNKGFGFVNIPDSTKRAAKLRYYGKVVKQYPYSYFLLDEIQLNKENYTKKELNDLLSLFDKEVQMSRSAKKLNSYLANRVDLYTPYPNMLLNTPLNKRLKILDTHAEVNLLVFWASWCGPCIKEIPELKELNQAFSGKGLHMASISIDEDENKWRKALDKEQMQWQQFIVEKDKVELVKQQFNFSSIPLMLLTDITGKEISRISGYSKDNVAKLRMSIAKQLSGELKPNNSVALRD